MTKLRVKVSVVAKRAKIEFKEGLGIGVLATQEVEFDVPDTGEPPATMYLTVLNVGEDLMKDAVEMKYEVVQ